MHLLVGITLIVLGAGLLVYGYRTLPTREKVHPGWAWFFWILDGLLFGGPGILGLISSVLGWGFIFFGSGR